MEHQVHGTLVRDWQNERRPERIVVPLPTLLVGVPLSTECVRACVLTRRAIGKGVVSRLICLHSTISNVFTDTIEPR